MEKIYTVAIKRMLASMKYKNPAFNGVLWELRDSNPRPSACKADALNQLS
jgi:hypothetical protein